ncbi:MAG TPA: hypothetical protein DC084_05105, partial [Cupriavidus sp.]|nr:hypothetical protein [Cupriavidus sp.]
FAPSREDAPMTANLAPAASPQSSAPLYQQVAGHYRQAISVGTLAPGDRMPSVRSLM